jgi:DNA-binding NtrC family response regulator
MNSEAGARVLVVEDDTALRDVLCEELQDRGHELTAAESVGAALQQLRTRDLEVAILDLMLPDGSGIQVLRQIAHDGLPVEAIVLTGYADVSTALEAMKLGAYDYLTKPTRMEELAILVERAAEKARLRRENVALRVRLESQQANAGVEGFVTADPRMASLLTTLEHAAASDLPVLIQGESGTGKELLARAVHQKSPRSAQPFVAINCSAIAENLVESELFGHERGAFTGAVDRKPGLLEVAHRGVFFLDEVGELNPVVQAKLLRATETKEFMHVGGVRTLRSDVRLVAATNKDLAEEMRAGRFRADLFYRLNGVTLRIPPLRERPDDIPLLALHFLRQLGGERQLTSRALQALKGYTWPGNVRELRMVIQRAAILARKDTLDSADMVLEASESWKVTALKTGLTLAELENEYIQTVLKLHNGHRGQTARALGIDPKTLYNKLGPEPGRRARE